ncbi:MAG: hypothetical protein IKI71_02395 [Lachnospiraceae bacterium]|nr:hypothetical protein [Lachnospiraceae bacterium]
MGILESIKLKLILEQPFFGNLLMHIKFKEDENVNGIGTDGIDIFYNPKKIEEIDRNHLSFLVMHQVIHIILYHVFRGIPHKNDELFHKASDLVANSLVLSNLDYADKDRLSDINIEHTVDFVEASNYTVEQVYDKLKKEKDKDDDSSSSSEEDNFLDSIADEQWNDEKKELGDDHSKWSEVKAMSESEKQQMQRKMSGYITDAMQQAEKTHGGVSDEMKRAIDDVAGSKVDWRTALQNFVETEVTDYSFNPPDKRFTYNDLLMPDFNFSEEKVTGVFFFIDVSGSMDEAAIAECKAEVKSCLRQYGEKVDGYLGYFDYKVSNLQRFEDEETMVSIEALGGGGTSFENIFKYLDTHSEEFECEKKKVIILTDGYADFPDEGSLNVDELMWVINNEEAEPPYGEVVRI